MDNKMESKMDTGIKMYELVCDPGNVHFTMTSKDMDEVLDAGVTHVKRIHHQDMSREDIRKLVRETNSMGDRPMTSSM